MWPGQSPLKRWSSLVWGKSLLDQAISLLFNLRSTLSVQSLLRISTLKENTREFCNSRGNHGDLRMSVGQTAYHVTTQMKLSTSSRSLFKYYFFGKLKLTIWDFFENIQCYTNTFNILLKFLFCNVSWQNKSFLWIQSLLFFLHFRPTCMTLEEIHFVIV